MGRGRNIWTMGMGRMGRGRRWGWEGEEVGREGGGCGDGKGRRWGWEGGGGGDGKGRRWGWEGGGSGDGWGINMVYVKRDNIPYCMVLHQNRSQVERDEKKALIAAGQNVADHTFSAEEVRMPPVCGCGMWVGVDDRGGAGCTLR